MATRPIVDNNATPPVADRMMLAEELLDLAERAQNHAHAAGSAIALKLGEKLFVRTSSGLAPEVGSSLPMGVGTIGECARLGKPLTASDDKVDAALRPLGVRSLIAVPIHHAGIFYGVLVVLGQTPDTFTRMHVAIMMTMGNEVARVLKRMEPVAVEIAPGAPLRPAAATPTPAVPDDNVVEIALSSTARQNIVETLKTIEQKPEPVAPAAPAPMRLIIDPPAPKRAVAIEDKPAPIITPKPVRQAAVSLPELDAAQVAPQPLPDLLVPGDDPRRYGTLKTAKSLEPKPTFTSANAYVVPTSPSRMKVPAMAAAAVLLAIIGYGVLRNSRTTAAAAATHEVVAVSQPAVTPTPVSAPVSTAVVETPKPAAATAVPVLSAKTEVAKQPTETKPS
jgi:GAF domain